MPLSLLTMSTASNFSGGLRFHHGVSLTGVQRKFECREETRLNNIHFLSLHVAYTVTQKEVSFQFSLSSAFKIRIK